MFLFEENTNSRSLAYKYPNSTLPNKKTSRFGGGALIWGYAQITSKFVYCLFKEDWNISISSFLPLIFTTKQNSRCREREEEKRREKNKTTWRLTTKSRRKSKFAKFSFSSWRIKFYLVFGVLILFSSEIFTFEQNRKRFLDFYKFIIQIHKTELYGFYVPTSFDLISYFWSISFLNKIFFFTQLIFCAKIHLLI